MNKRGNSAFLATKKDRSDESLRSSFVGSVTHTISEREVARDIQLRIAADHGDQKPDVIGHGSMIGRPVFDGSHRNLNHRAD